MVNIYAIVRVIVRLQSIGVTAIGRGGQITADPKSEIVGGVT